MAADPSVLKRRIYNLAGLSFSAGELAAEIKKHVPDFECTFNPDFRQKIADTWPKSLNDSSNSEWGWSFKQTLPELVTKIFTDIAEAKKSQAK